MKWSLHERGFLPNQDPVFHLTDTRFQKIQQLGADLPRLVHECAFRNAAAAYLSDPIDWDDVLPVMPDAEIEWLFVLFSYFASAYVHAPGLAAVNCIPSYLALPLVRLARQVDRPPILSYASYCLHNWRRLDPAGPVALGNLALLQNFSLAGDGKSDEDWFILVHVDIEARAGEALQAVHDAAPAIAADKPEQMESLLGKVAASLGLMNKTLMRMPEGCSTDVYFRKVRPYIFGFTDVVYEGSFGEKPQSYRGETGAQSSIVPTMLAALGIRHTQSLLTKHLEDMPTPHRRFISEQKSVREFVVRHAAESSSSGQPLRGLYNECLRELLAFRSRHFEYAVNYIEKKVANPIATGGTPYIPWLRQMIEETKDYQLR